MGPWFTGVCGGSSDDCTGIKGWEKEAFSFASAWSVAIALLATLVITAPPLY